MTADNDIKFSQSFSKDAWQEYWINASIEENRAKIEKEPIVDQVERICKVKGVRGYDRSEIARVYIRLFRDARKGIDVDAARAVVNTVSLLLDYGDNSIAFFSKYCTV
jgi:hypothetical protein